MPYVDAVLACIDGQALMHPATSITAAARTSGRNFAVGTSSCVDNLLQSSS
jgi:hypothetical protein